MELWFDEWWVTKDSRELLLAKPLLIFTKPLASM
jgi:hypothetical protein